MTEYLWPITLIIIALIAAYAFLEANRRKYVDREAKKFIGASLDELRAKISRLEKQIDKVDTEEIEALAEEVAEMSKNGRATPHEAWLTEKVKPIFERMNVLSKDLGEMKTLFARYEALGKLGKQITGAKEL